MVTKTPARGDRNSAERIVPLFRPYRLQVAAVIVLIVVNRENLAALRQLIESGEVRVVIALTYPLDQAATAVTHMLEHHPGGKIAITV